MSDNRKRQRSISGRRRYAQKRQRTDISDVPELPVEIWREVYLQAGRPLPEANTLLLGVQRGECAAVTRDFRLCGQRQGVTPSVRLPPYCDDQCLERCSAWLGGAVARIRSSPNRRVARARSTPLESVMVGGLTLSDVRIQLAGRFRASEAWLGQPVWGLVADREDAPDESSRPLTFGGRDLFIERGFVVTNLPDSGGLLRAYLPGNVIAVLAEGGTAYLVVEEGVLETHDLCEWVEAVGRETDPRARALVYGFELANYGAIYDSTPSSRGLVVGAPSLDGLPRPWRWAIAFVASLAALSALESVLEVDIRRGSGGVIGAERWFLTRRAPLGLLQRMDPDEEEEEEDRQTLRGTQRGERFAAIRSANLTHLDVWAFASDRSTFAWEIVSHPVSVDEPLWLPPRFGPSDSWLSIPDARETDPSVLAWLAGEAEGIGALLPSEWIMVGNGLQPVADQDP